MESPVSHEDRLAQLKNAKRLPSPPGTAIKVLDLCRRDDVCVQDIADALMPDPALSARLLKFANSPIAAIGRQVTSVRDAVLMLGLRTVKLTALGFSLVSTDQKHKCRGFDLKRFWVESFATAVIARQLAVKFFKTEREESFTAGLLANIGQLALVHAMPAEYGRVIDDVAAGKPLIEAEHERIKLDHVEVGAFLLRDWQLPELLVSAIGGQLAPNDKNPSGAALSRVVAAAKTLVPLFINNGEVRPAESQKARDLIENTLKLDESSWKLISEDILGNYLQVAAVFDIKFDNDTAIHDLYAEVQEEVTRAGVAAQVERTQAMESNKVLLKKAQTDSLTGVANRARFDERLSEMLSNARRQRHDFALLLLDIDHFKKFNDTYGHQTGDLVLRQVAQAVTGTLREVDLFARYGGEEFGIIAPEADRKGACALAARVRKCVEDLRVMVEGHTLQVTISIGLGVGSDYPQVPSSEQLVKDTDEQLYLSKKNGRNTWTYKNASLHAPARP